MIKRLLKNSLSIKNKIILISFSGLAIALFMVSAMLVFQNSQSESKELSNRLLIQSQIIANNSLSALLFDDPATATEVLTALQADNSINSANIETKTKQLFATYLKSTDAPSNHLTLYRALPWLKKEFSIQQDIFYHDDRIGSVHITASLSQLHQNNINYILITSLVSICSMMLTLLLINAALRHTISPIISLTKTTQKISRLNNYKLRAEVLSQDEIGELARNFNDMLSEIEHKDLILERTVADRTAELLQLNNRLQHEASHDPLTGLANRLLFEDRLQVVIAQAQRNKSLFALMYFDLDHFKAINDTLGHDTGDALLIAVTQRMQIAIRAEDTLCRIGGDEFTLIINTIESAADAETVAQKMLTAFALPFKCNEHELSISSSIGISLYPEHSAKKIQLKQFADIAMYTSKQSGRNNYHFFTKKMQTDNSQKMDTRVLLKTNLKSSIANGELEVHYQPQVNMDSRIVGLEALLRWKDSNDEFISPNVFIPLAEESGLIQDIEEWAFSVICQDYATWQKAGIDKLNISINISGYRLRQNGFTQFIYHILEEHNLSADFLTLEITENDLMQNVDEMTEILSSLHENNIRIAVDNFGSGYTSLNYLQQLPIDEFKISSEFIRHLKPGYNDNPVINAIIGLAKTLNKSVTAMGIENHEQLLQLDSFGCNNMQGYLFSRPLNKKEVSDLLSHTQFLPL